jgi:hypothetical protein
MNIEEELRVREHLRDDLCQREEGEPVHQWQKDILEQRELLVEQGKAQFVDWETAKELIAGRISLREK